jgi:hypothetical protein
MEKRKKIELILIVIYYLLISLVIGFFKLGYLFGAILYSGFPAIYITLKRKIIFKKTFLFSSLVTFPLVLVFDHIATINQTWYENATLGIRILNSFPIDTFIWTFLYVYFIVAFYEYFFDKDRIKKSFSKSIKYLIYMLIGIVLIFGIIYATNKSLFIIPYFYAFFVLTLFILPPLLIIWRHPKLMKKIIYQGLYFLLLSIIYELVALYANHWSFPGKYIGFVEIFSFRFPFEEFLWLVFCVPSILAIYEYFADDKK